jgi:branched-chain amino acid transport system permease protein
VLTNLINILISGVAFGILLFLMAGGLSITLGLMNFANMAHGSFAMLGGYVAVTGMQKLGWPFLLALPAAALAAGVLGYLLERLLFRRLYGASDLEQVLLTIGVVFVSIAAATFFWGAAQQPVRLPAWLNQQIQFGPFDINSYRLFTIAMGGALTIALILAVNYTNFGAKIRAGVDNRRMTASCGINIDRLFSLSFGIGSAIAGLGGALSIQLVGLDPQFPLRYLVLMLLVVVVGGLGSIPGTLVAALVLGIGEVLGKYYVPEATSFIIYAIPVAVLLAKPAGLFGRA